MTASADASGNAFDVLIRDGRVIDVNEGCVRMLGYTREELIGQSGETIQFWAEPAGRVRMLAVLQEQGFLHDWEFQFRKKGLRTLDAF